MRNPTMATLGGELRKYKYGSRCRLHRPDKILHGSATQPIDSAQPTELSRHRERRCYAPNRQCSARTSQRGGSACTEKSILYDEVCISICICMYIFIYRYIHIYMRTILNFNLWKEIVEPMRFNRRPTGTAQASDPMSKAALQYYRQRSRDCVSRPYPRDFGCMS